MTTTEPKFSFVTTVLVRANPHLAKPQCAKEMAELLERAGELIEPLPDYLGGSEKMAKWLADFARFQKGER